MDVFRQVQAKDSLLTVSQSNEQSAFIVPNLTAGPLTARVTLVCYQSLTQATPMSRLLVFPFDKVTSAVIAPINREILIRTYTQLFYHPRQPGESVVAALKRAPRLLPLANEPQGEAVGWAIDGSGYYTTNEKPDANRQMIYWYKRR